MKKTINFAALQRAAIAVSAVVIIAFFAACAEDDDNTNTTNNNTGTAGKWTLLSDSPFGSDSVKSVAWGGGKFVAVGSFGKIAHSSDGKNWTAVSPTPFGNNDINCVSFGNGKFMAGGSGGRLAFSDDGGESWTLVATSGFNTSEINGAAWGADKWVAVGRTRIAYSNAEGTTWTGASSNTPFDFGQGSPPLIDVVFGDNRFVMVGQAGGQGHGSSLAYSNTGINNAWTSVLTEALITDGLVSVTYGNGKFVTFSQTKILYSANGADWLAAATTPLALDVQLTGVAAGNGKFTAVGYNDAIIDSTDGITWSIQEGISFNKHFNDIAFGDGTWVAVGMSGAIAYLEDK